MSYDVAEVLEEPTGDDDGAVLPIGGDTAAPESPTVKALLVANILPLYFKI